MEIVDIKLQRGLYNLFILHDSVYLKFENSPIFTIFVIYENQAICEHTPLVGGSWILSGRFQPGAFGLHGIVQMTNKTSKCIKYDLCTFGYKQTTMDSHQNSELNGDGPYHLDSRKRGIL